MSIGLYTIIFAAAVIVTLMSGIWLLLHLTALARTAAGTADVVPSPKRPRASPRRVRLVVAAFSIGLIATLAMQILAMTGVANSWIG